jgi:adenine-specific DNA-methyltransferase
MDDDTNIQKIDLDKVDWRGSREFFESLGEALDRLDDKDEAYDFTWVGKRKAIIEAGAPINKTFRPNVESSKNWESTENLFIEGDNLDALKLLQESYLGKVKMIYIDPPYNTGKDFVYHDNFKANVADYEEATEYKDESGNIQFRKNEKSNGRYHSDWLSMMFPRLKLARNLLTDDGVIFISIDDNEQANLKKLCDEVFGEDSFMGQIVRRNTATAKSSAGIGIIHDYILVYAKGPDPALKGLLSTSRNLKDEYFDERGYYDFGRLARASLRYNPNQDYPITIDGFTYYPGGDKEAYEKRQQGHHGEKDWQWRWTKPMWEVGLANGFFANSNPESGVINVKSYERARIIKDGKNYKVETIESKTTNINSLLLDNMFLNQRGGTETAELVGGSIFSYPKPIDLLKLLVSLTQSPDALIVDFFSGSGTTAHAVMQLNAEDGGNRKWIMVQLPEETDESSEAFKAGYKTIPDISRERIRRAGDKIASENPETKVDYGFRALTIADSNYKEVYRAAHETTQQELLGTVDNVKEDRSELDLLYGVLTASALELNRPLESREIAGSTVYVYDYLGEVSGLIACFADTVSEETIKDIAGMKPLTAVFKDSTFPDSQAKVNLSEHFRIISPDTKVKVI